MASYIGGVLTQGSTRYWDPGEGGDGFWVNPAPGSSFPMNPGSATGEDSYVDPYDIDPNVGEGNYVPSVEGKDWWPGAAGGNTDVPLPPADPGGWTPPSIGGWQPPTIGSWGGDEGGLDLTPGGRGGLPWTPDGTRGEIDMTPGAGTGLPVPELPNLGSLGLVSGMMPILLISMLMKD